MQSDSTRGTRPWTTSVAAVSRVLFPLICSFMLLVHQVAGDPIQSITGTLYAENFTYYKLSGEGWLRLELYSLQGDVDLYVSGLTLNPSFTDYELKSESCGMDVVDIHSTMRRPVGIGIYGHPFYLQSDYRMDIYIVKEVEVDEYELLLKAFHFYDDDAVDGQEESKTKNSRKPRGPSVLEEKEEDSFWWNVLITFLKFLLEIIM